MPLRYQWFENATALPNQTNATLTITNVQAANGGMYCVVVSDTVGSALSVNATLALDVAGITKNIDGTMTVDFAGIPGQAYHLEAATNLGSLPIVWQSLAGSMTDAPSGGWWQFTDPQATNYPQRFYRSVSP
jgi:hypothetical protein